MGEEMALKLCLFLLTEFSSLQEESVSERPQIPVSYHQELTQVSAIDSCPGLSGTGYREETESLVGRAGAILPLEEGLPL